MGRGARQIAGFCGRFFLTDASFAVMDLRAYRSPPPEPLDALARLLLMQGCLVTWLCIVIGADIERLPPRMKAPS